jgi:predicted NodU family carbamoyl transferase
MLVLGINGWPDRGHDAAACLVVDGELVAMAEEERFTRHKHAHGAAPRGAARFCLDQAGLKLDDIDVVAFGWDVPRLFTERGFGWDHTERDLLDMFFPPADFPRQRDPEFRFVHHHLSHAASAYHLSGDDRAAILVIDGQGENESASLAIGESGRIRILESIPVSWSLGYFYDAVGQFIGLGRDQAGKLMGLAPYGTAADPDPTTIAFDDQGRYSVPFLPPDLRSTSAIDEFGDVTARWLAHLGSLPRAGHADPFEHRDLAATAQAVIERAVIGMAERVLARTGLDTLHVAGGVGFNATLNGRLLRHDRVRRLFVQPLAGDAGVALGAAVHVAAEHGDRIRPMRSSLAFGAEYSEGRLRECLEDAGLRYEEPSDICASVAAKLAGGQIVGWFQGRAEAGPRALGHRSILAAPDRAATRDRINLEIKRREWWRPLAPSLTEEAFPDVIRAPVPLPHMVVTAHLHPEAAGTMGAVAHVDGTTRPQAVSAIDEPVYHRLLTAVGRETGRPVVLNTSFNGKEEPIVWSPANAIATFRRLELDALALGPFLVTREP